MGHQQIYKWLKMFLGTTGRMSNVAERLKGLRGFLFKYLSYFVGNIDYLDNVFDFLLWL